MPPVCLILGDQLFADISALPSGPIVMVEDRKLASHARYHRHKLVLTFAGMRHFARRHFKRVRYYPLEAHETIFGALDIELRREDTNEVHTFAPADRFFAHELRQAADRRAWRLVEHPNPMFVTSEEDWRRYAASHPTRRMAEFYAWQRRRLNILIDSRGQPVGGRWSYDPENRKRLPASISPPGIFGTAPDPTTGAVIEMVDTEFSGNPGRALNFALPVTAEAAEAWLDEFLELRLDQFGDFEDAISASERTLFHSLISPLLNVGLLIPSQVIDAVLRRHKRRPVLLNSLEGFVRQVIGWREFMHGIDREYAGMNLPAGPFDHRRKLNACWYEGSTGLLPLDRTIQRVVDHGWCHHIERLMLIGAPMLMCEVDPMIANRWFLEMFVDATDWVMRPNVVGMSQFADGGYFATKPYFSGSNYILKMSDYPRGDWCEVWDGLYWRFISRHQAFFAQNPRLSPIANGVDRLEPARRARIFAAAKDFIDRVTNV